MSNDSMVYVGIDCSDEDHKVFVTNDASEKLAAFSVPHSPEGAAEMFARVARVAVGKNVLFALEQPSGLLVSAILERGFTIYPINPKTVDRGRDRFTLSGKKDDAFDARVLADLLRTDRHLHHPLVPDSPACRNLRILTRNHEKLARLKKRILNQVTATLKEYYPVALTLFTKIDQPLSIAFLKQFPGPEKFSRLTGGQIKRFLRKHRCPNQEQKAEELFRLSREPQFHVEEFIAESRAMYLLALLTQLEDLLKALKDLEEKIEAVLDEHPDKDVFLSLPGSGKLTSARLISEFGDNRDRYKKASDIQALAGTCPVTRQSSRSRKVFFRRSCRKSFRNTVTRFAFNSLRNSSWASEKYLAHLEHGKRKTHALRCLGNSWLEVVFTMWKQQTPYDVQKHLKPAGEPLPGRDQVQVAAVC